MAKQKIEKKCNDRGGDDKWYHRMAGFMIAMAVGILLSCLPLEWASWVKALTAFGVATLIGVAKEVRDMRRPGNHFCWWDLLADMEGAVLGALFAWLCAWGVCHDIYGNVI